MEKLRKDLWLLATHGFHCASLINLSQNLLIRNERVRWGVDRAEKFGLSSCDLYKESGLRY